MPGADDLGSAGRRPQGTDQAEAAFAVLDPLDDEPEEPDEDEPEDDEPELSEDELLDEPDEDDESEEDSDLPGFTVLDVEVLRESVR